MHWQCPWGSKEGGSLSCKVGEFALYDTND